MMWRVLLLSVPLLAGVTAFQRCPLTVATSSKRASFTPRVVRSAPLCSAAAEEDSTSDAKEDSKRILAQIKTLWELSKPYYMESKKGRLLLLGVIVLTFLQSGVSVAFSYLGKDFWNALSAKEVSEYYNVLQKYIPALLVGAPVVTLYRYQREQLAVAWREWMTDRTLQLYQNSRVYYALERDISSNDDDNLRPIDNPDQRITQDVKTFTSFSLELLITILTSVIDLASFAAILYSIYPQLFLAIIAYSAFGTITTTLLGKKLVGLNYNQLQKEADLRYSLVRLRDNAESIAFYRGEDLEGQAVQERLTGVVENTRDINKAQRNLEFFTTGYRYIIQILPISVVAPKYFAGDLQLGQLSQSVGAFNHILSDLSIIVNQFESLSLFSAGIDRLSGFYKAMREADPQRVNQALLDLPPLTTNVTTMEHALARVQHTGTEKDKQFGSIELKLMSSAADLIGNAHQPASKTVLSIDHLDLCTPDRKRALILDLSLSLREGQNLLIVGDSGAGKSSLLRGIAGLWTSGNGSIERPSDDEVYFLPQRPYCSLGTLKDQLLYPSLDHMDPSDYPEGHVLSRSHLLQSLSDEELLDVLDEVDLKELALRAGDGDPIKGLRTELDWSNTLSLGEQQRLAFGRLLVNKPKLVILDEATSALDLVAEARMYTLLQNMARKTVTSGGKVSAPGVTYVSVGHRPSLLAYHDKRLRLGGVGGNKNSMEDIEKSSISITDQISNL